MNIGHGLMASPLNWLVAKWSSHPFTWLCSSSVCFTVVTLCTRFKPINNAMLDSIIPNIIYNDRFQVVDHSKKGESGSALPCAPTAAAATTNSDWNRMVWQTSFE